MHQLSVIVAVTGWMVAAMIGITALRDRGGRDEQIRYSCTLDRRPIDCRLAGDASFIILDGK